MFKSSLIALGVASALALSTSAAAQEASNKEQSASVRVVVRDDARTALAERLVRLTLVGMDKVMQGLIEQQITQAGDRLTDAQATWMRRSLPTIMETNMRPLIESAKVEYAARFTEAELNAMIAFYEAPMGQDIAFKQMEVGGALGGAMQAFQRSFLTELLTKFCGEFDCTADAAKEAPTTKSPRR
ncbi:DUF2059 domain-containing protein [Brevundimonas faecalis]|uniref:DUF2059 domain-containing protein n=1 Tax=Brevundimonas faecalis TaxID=947378 RepID=A0ABV2R8W9_9CAUL